MKTKIIISLLGLFFISGAFGDGCEEEEPKPDYINVTVKTNGNLFLKDNSTGEFDCDSRINVTMLRVDVTKAGGEQINFFPSISFPNCYFETGVATFKLYREQPIEVMAYSEQVPGGYTQIRGVEILTWDEVYPGKDFGETYNWESHVTAYWLYN
jgi:hypothetical protein